MFCVSWETGLHSSVYMRAREWERVGDWPSEWMFE